MFIIRKENSPRYKRDNIESFLLVSKKPSNSNNLSVTIVEMEPSGFQHKHKHDPEQIYYVLEGEGTINLNDEEQKVTKGDCIYFPSNVEHGLKNIGPSKLIYLSAAAPSFTKKQCEELWPLKSLNELSGSL